MSGVRVFGPERDEPWHQPVFCKVRCAGDLEWLVLCGLCQVLHAIDDMLEPFLQVCGEPCPSLGRDHLPAVPDKQGLAEVCLETADMLRDGRMRHVQFARCCAETASAHCRLEPAQGLKRGDVMPIHL